MAPITPDSFRRCCAQFATGVCIATVFDGQPLGLTINSFTSVSLHPPIVLIALDREAKLTERFQRQHIFAINILAEAQRELSSTFAWKPENRFEGIAWHRSERGAPVIEGALAVLECRLIRVLPVGDHDVLFGEALAASVAGEGDPLIYFRSRYASVKKLAPG
jgi:flavin reductase (DIM6/NTAB) family NADH-FMN oxidoreductase RutF